MSEPPPIPEEPFETRIDQCLSVLEELAGDGALLARVSEARRVALLKAAGELVRPSRGVEKQRQKESQRQKKALADAADRRARASTGIRAAREAEVFLAPGPWLGSRDEEEPRRLDSPRPCYVCKAEYDQLHFFYDALCPACADFNYRKRFQSAPMDGKVALITGARVKIGYQAALMLLRAGAQVIVTTRFPVDAARRYSREPDFGEWGDRLRIFGLDLRHTPSVELFCGYIEQAYERLDVLVNNAAQTVRRPPGFYSHLLADEVAATDVLGEASRGLLKDYQELKGELSMRSSAGELLDPALPLAWDRRVPGLGIVASAPLSQIPYTHDPHPETTQRFFPGGRLDADLQQVDLRTTNSWRLRLGEIPTAEMLELHLVNAVAPFVLCNRLIFMMRRDNTGQKHIVNVSAMEGKFQRFKKADRHPHTNMAKAALNMLTHTSAADLARDGIFMNAVDTGWVTDEDPAQLALFKRERHDFQPPLDIVDGAARVCDPFFDGINTGRHWCGRFLKDYRPIDW